MTWARPLGHDSRGTKPGNRASINLHLKPCHAVSDPNSRQMLAEVSGCLVSFRQAHSTLDQRCRGASRSALWAVVSSRTVLGGSSFYGRTPTGIPRTYGMHHLTIGIHASFEKSVSSSLSISEFAFEPYYLSLIYLQYSFRKAPKGLERVDNAFLHNDRSGGRFPDSGCWSFLWKDRNREGGM